MRNEANHRWLTRAAQLLLALAGMANAQPVSTVFITLGRNAQSVERWDGSIRVSNGELVALEGWHFSAEDRIQTPASWHAGTRRDAVAPYADVHYTEIRPGSKPEVRFHAIGLFATIRDAGAARVRVHTAQGDFDFAPGQAGAEPIAMLGGRATVARVPAAEKLSAPEFEDDDPAIAVLPDGAVAVAWVAYRERADRVLLREMRQGAWTPAVEIVPAAHIFRCSLAADSGGNLWVFWIEREGDQWHLWARRRTASGWGAPERLSSAGTNLFHRATAAPDGTVYVAWQSVRQGRSDIYVRSRGGSGWSREMRVSDAGNNWEPAIAAGPDGAAYIAWDTYDGGNYDVRFRPLRQGQLAPVRAVTSSPKFQAHAAVAVDREGRPWVAWDESGVNWGKDQGFLIVTPLATPLHREREIALAAWDGARWMRPGPEGAPMAGNAEHPQIAFDGGGNLTLVFRHWTRRNDRTIGSPMDWENYITRFDGRRWTAPGPIPHSAGSIEKYAALARGRGGEIRAAWMTDNRPFATQIPGNADVYAADLGQGAAASWSSGSLAPYVEPFAEAIPVHANEAENVKTVRDYRIAAGGRQYRIYRGDMHRHSDVSQDFKYDGSLLEIYRYAIDAAAFDYIAITDHQAGYDQEFTWWQNQKLVDLFQLGTFSPLYAYERSVPFPNGHRNVIFAHRGVRTLPIPEDERLGKTGAAKLYEYLRQNGGIAMPHSTATDQGTDWRDNGGALEPLVEIYQGYRTSYEYEGAPRSATTLNPQAQKSGWQPAGFVWNALAKGYKLGMQSSSDHWSTHISYACLVAESLTREALFDAIQKRHAYGATDNIVLDFREGDHLMGDAFTSAQAPRLRVRAIGTDAIRQIDVIKNGKFIYTTRPATKEAGFELTDQEYGAGESWYYVRVLQQDGQLAWSSPMWVRKP